VWWGLLLALAGAVCAGIGAVLQALAARAVPDRGTGLRTGLLLDLVRQWRFLAGIGLDICSFFTSFAALRVLPIFIVQAAVSSNLAVTAVVAWRVLGTRLRWTERGAVVAVCLGLAGLGVSATRQGTSHGDTALHVGLLAAVGALALLGVGGARLPGRWGAAALGLLAGFAFGLVNLASRVLPSLSPADLITDPATWVLPTAGFCAVLFYNTALQRESVVAASAGTVVGQTIFPTAVGLALLGDDTRAGFEPLAVAGFVVAVVGALLLARFGDLAEDTRTVPDTTTSTPVTTGEPSGS
jgi:drug/metabolite transporter (DMT)-like permease